MLTREPLRLPGLAGSASSGQRLEQQAKELGQKPELRPLAARERESGSGGSQTPEALQKQIDAMQNALGKAAANSDKLDKMRDSLNDAQKSLSSLGDKDSAAADAARQKLAQSLSELSKQMKEMGQNLEGLEEAMAKAPRAHGASADDQP